MLKCVKCSIPVENALLCDTCLAVDKTGYGTMEKLGNKCEECDSTAATLVNGVCNTCLSKKDEEDMIEWPKHYNMGKIQPIDVIEDWKLDFRLASALKYIARAGKKDPTKTKEDLEKCIWYVQRYIDKELL
jgi:hypothetical protein